VEVANPGRSPLELSRLDYRVSATNWFQAQGQLVLTRSIAPGSTGVVRIPLSIIGTLPKNAVSYRMNGRLFATSHNILRQWPVSAKGQLSPWAKTPVAPIRIAAN